MINKLHDMLDKSTPIRNGKFMACCPAHEDINPSLAVQVVSDGRILVHCFAGCDSGSIMSALGLSLSDLFPDGAIAQQLRGWASMTKNRKPTIDDDVLALADATRKRGGRLNKADLERERQAYLRTKR